MVAPLYPQDALSIGHLYLKFGGVRPTQACRTISMVSAVKLGVAGEVAHVQGGQGKDFGNLFHVTNTGVLVGDGT